MVSQKVPGKMHTYIVAGTGAGKSELLKTLVWQHIVKNLSAVVVIDPNGDFSQQIATFKEFSFSPMRERLIYIDPGLSSNYTPVINPFDLSADDDDTREREVQQMLKLLLQVFHSVGAPATNPDGVAATILFTGCEQNATCFPQRFVAFYG